MIIARHEYMERPILESDLSCKGDRGVTKQADLKECDINLIFKKYERSGLLPEMIVKDGRYGEFADVPTYQESMEIVRMAQEQFSNLDVTIRNRFSNDPALFLAFVHDNKNIDEMDRMGLLTPEASKALADSKKTATSEPVAPKAQ
ncbi:MAG: internal scaffolding protein [Microvirus sp.]|nr:MAG: internal scaffolding protein [Microvirus sp.]